MDAQPQVPPADDEALYLARRLSAGGGGNPMLVSELELWVNTPPEFGPVALASAASAAGKEVVLSPQQIKKLRRNERDRKRSSAKKPDSHEGKPLWTPKSPEPRSPSPSEGAAASSSQYPSASTPVTRDDYARLAGEIGSFRRQNAVMKQQLATRGLFSNSLRYGLLDFSPRAPPVDRALPFAPLTQEEALACVRQTLQCIHKARLLYASDKRFLDRPTFLGWRQYTERQGSIATFAVKKALAKASPQQLMDRTWRLQTDSKQLNRLGPARLRTHISQLQEVSQDLRIIDRRTDDPSHAGGGDETLALRTVYLLLRVAHGDGSQTLGIKTLDLPTAKQRLRDDEVWWDIFYWICVSPEGSRGGGDVLTVTEFGGTNACASEEVASSRLEELVFLAIRWETLAVAPCLLKH
ncbi:hypothetical protein BBJ28_00016408 [Nothophytophthora sp. Chile5]|nr:hypothetical protein BBJ28_00016408 [Nothophytophthora sp. Chile5]